MVYRNYNDKDRTSSVSLKSPKKEKKKRNRDRPPKPVLKTFETNSRPRPRPQPSDGLVTLVTRSQDQGQDLGHQLSRSEVRIELYVLLQKSLLLFLSCGNL